MTDSDERDALYTDGTEHGTAPDCTFCDQTAEKTIAAKEAAHGKLTQVPLCGAHYQDYRSVHTGGEQP